MVYKSDAEYAWGTYSFKIDPQAAGKILSDIYSEHGEVTSDLLVQYAKNKKSLIHNCFEWDDTKAANEFRKQQARTFIQNVHIVKYHKNGISDTRAYVSVLSESGRSYQPTAVVLGDRELRLQILNEAKQNIAYWANELRKYKEFAKIVMKIEQIVMDLSEFDDKKKVA
jgi:hypothetical protein